MQAAHGWSSLTFVGLRVVQEVAARGSFTAAADALGYTQSAVSRQVAAMEEAVGASLFERLPRGVRPSRAGAILVRHADGVLTRADAAMLELAGLQDRLEGRVAVGAFPSALAVLVPRAAARLQREHPGVALSLAEGTTPTHLRRLRAGRLELAVIARGPDLPCEVDDLRADVVLEGGLLLAVPAEHRLARRGTVDVAELEHEPWIAGDVGGADPAFGAWPGLIDPRIAYAVRDWPSRLGLVAAGLGVATVPSMIVGTTPPGVRLIAVDEPRPTRRTVLAVTHEHRSPGAAALVAVLREEGARLVEEIRRATA
jgi:DNA-binding transcriptional LysR family regulator